MRELIRYFIHRVRRDELMLEAASLSFTTVLSLIPALTVVVSIFTMAPAFEPLKNSLQEFVSANFMPVFSEAVSEYVGNFVSKAGKMTVTGSVALVVIALMLVRSIDNSINRIWRGGRRKRTMTFAIYWTLLTVGPLAVALSLWGFSKILTVSIMGYDLTFASKVLYFFLPIFIEMAVVMALYLTVPVAIVRFADALAGAFLVTVLFEISKKAFSIFILNFSDYEAIYGVLAALPVLMIWININWGIILLGAEFTSSLGMIRAGTITDAPPLLVKLSFLLGRGPKLGRTAKRGSAAAVRRRLLRRSGNLQKLGRS